jgi:hypothetical protein
MNSRNKNNFFRLSAVLYANNNDLISSDRILKQVIEVALFSIENQWVQLSYLVSFIENNYNLNIDESEIEKISIVDRNTSFNYDPKKRDICLREETKKKIKEQVHCNMIDNSIAIFHENCKINLSIKALTDLLYRFLYDLLSENVESFKILFKKQNDIDSLSNFDYSVYSQEDKEIINKFLGWENDEKNKAIYDIANFSLEYCMISNNNKEISKPRFFNNKSFYLDTNVIFRTIGLQGDNLKERAITLIERMTKTGSKLFITKFTDSEFQRTINSLIHQISKYPLQNAMSEQLLKNDLLNGISDFHRYYYAWHARVVNTNVNMFKAYILNEYKDIIKKYSITLEKSEPEQDEEIINDYISSFNQTLNPTKQNESRNQLAIETDCRNIRLIETRHCDYDCYLLSTDKLLKQWDYDKRDYICPIVILPNHWMNLLLRYDHRTKDDYKSFVSFLNLPIIDRQINSDNIHKVLSGISEIASSPQMQEQLLEDLVKDGSFRDLESTDYEDIVRKGELVLQEKVEKVQYEKNEAEKKLHESTNINLETRAKLDEANKANSLQQEEIDSLKYKMNKLSNDHKSILRSVSAQKELDKYKRNANQHFNYLIFSQLIVIISGIIGLKHIELNFYVHVLLLIIISTIPWGRLFLDKEKLKFGMYRFLCKKKYTTLCEKKLSEFESCEFK